MTNQPAKVTFISATARPLLEVGVSEGRWRLVPFKPEGERDSRGFRYWVARPRLPRQGTWRFRIRLRPGFYLPTADQPCFETALRELWIKHGAIYPYEPPRKLSRSRVLRVAEFPGSLTARPLYIYLPRGYAQAVNRQYPVIYMQDGQNCFEAYVGDSFAGSWRADETADYLINRGEMQECVIVGIGHGGAQRTVEYLPPYARMPQPIMHPTGRSKQNLMPLPGLAEQTFRFYRDDVIPHIQQHYRVSSAREQIATIGSSMGGLFALYLGWEHPEFARNIAAMSTSFWTTRRENGQYEAVERLRRQKPRDIRLWLDSGTQSAPGQGDDGLALTEMARDALLDNGYISGDNFHYHRADGATHSEAAWAARLDKVFRFLFPLR